MTQNYVVRVFFRKVADAENMQNNLLNLDLDSDYVEADKSEPGQFKLIFTADTIETAVKAMKSSCFLDGKTDVPRWFPRPTHYDIFNPAEVEAGFTKLTL